MAKYNTKFKIGENVDVYGIPGKITAIHIRGSSRSYSIGYVKDGEIIETCCVEVEIEHSSKSKLGFKNNNE